MRLNLNKIIETLKHIREYIFPVKKLTDKFQSIKVPIHNKNRDCTQDLGCDEIYENDLKLLFLKS